MNETPWTPGPWLVSARDDNAERIVAPNFMCVAHGIDNAQEFGPSLGNARLIAAAPEMAEALEQTAAAMDALHPSSAGDMNDGDYARLWNAARDRLEELSRRIRGDGA